MEDRRQPGTGITETTREVSFQQQPSINNEQGGAGGHNHSSPFRDSGCVLDTRDDATNEHDVICKRAQLMSQPLPATVAVCISATTNASVVEIESYSLYHSKNSISVSHKVVPN